MTKVINYLGYILSLIILTLSILGARLQNNYVLYAMLSIIIVSLLFVVFDKVNEKQYPVLIFFIGLGLIYQVSLMTNYLVGTDIHYEYYFALQTYNNGSWDSTLGHSYNAATSISVFIPMMARLLHIPLEWAFKVIPPLFLASIPVVTYHIFKNEFDAKTAFLSTFFFISIPTMFLELSGLAKQAIGELFLISCLSLIVYNTFKRRWLRYVLICLFAVLTALSHYSMGGTLFCYLLGAVILLPIGKYLFRRPLNITLKYLVIVFLLFTAISGLFYGWASRGAPLQDILASAGMTSGVIPSPSAGLITPPDSVMYGEDSGSSHYNHWVYPEPAVAVALGADFSSADPISKVFRIFQYITQILIIVGYVYLLIHYKKRSLGYMVFLCLSGVLLCMVIFWVGFSPLFNASRFYNLILLFMSPAMIIGGKLIFRNYKILTIAVLIPYFIFTSGAVFEIAKIDNLNSITIPYSHSLSANRLDSTALFTNDDIIVRDWIKANDKFPIYGDLWGATAMFEVQSNLSLKVNKMIDKPFIYCFLYDEDKLEYQIIPDDCYIYLRERNVEYEELTYQVGVGLRESLSYDVVKFDDVLEGRQVLFQSGNSVVYGYKE